VEKARFDKMLASEEIRNLVGALGTGIGQDEFNDEQLRYHKIIIMTDADVDGAHIRTLLLTFFYRQMPSLIEKGYLYVAQPPLYRIHLGKKKELFLKDDDEMDSYLFDKVVNDIAIQPDGYETRIKGVKLKTLLEDISQCYENIELLAIHDYWKNLVEDLFVYDLNDPLLFEDIEKVRALSEYLKSKDYNTTEIQPENSEKFKNGYHFYAGVKDLAYMTAHICADVISSPEYRRSFKAFSRIKKIFLSGKITVFKGENIIEEFEKLDDFLLFVKNYGTKGLSFQRYKGLGEMNPEQLWETTMNPEKRTLLKVSIQDADEAENLFTTLMGEKIEPRKEFIQNHALEVSELDI
jgi:DNA gyrase subunit B